MICTLTRTKTEPGVVGEKITLIMECEGAREELRITTLKGYMRFSEDGDAKCVATTGDFWSDFARLPGVSARLISHDETSARYEVLD